MNDLWSNKMKDRQLFLVGAFSCLLAFILGISIIICWPEDHSSVPCYDARDNVIEGVTCVHSSPSALGIYMTILGLFGLFFYGTFSVFSPV